MNEPIGPEKCPITGLPFFMNIEHPELGMIATYGGPFDSYTIPTADDDDEGCFRSERYDHEMGTCRWRRLSASARCLAQRIIQVESMAETCVWYWSPIKSGFYETSCGW